MEAGDRNDGREYDEPRKETFCEFAQKNEVKNSNDRLLDLVLVSSEMDEVHVCIADEVLVLVDQQHPPLAVTVRRCARAESGPAPPTLPPLTTLSSWDFSKADYHALYSTVAAVDWSTLYRVQEPEEALDCFYAALNDIFNECIPKKRIRKVNSRHIYPRWYTVEIIREIQHKARLHKLYKAKGSKVNYQAFSESRARVKEMIIAEHKRHLERVQSRLVEDPKTFWEYVREKRGAVNRKKITKDGNTLPESECAQEFANYFLSVYGTSAAVLDVNEAELSSRAGSARVHVARLTEAEVLTALTRLKPKQSAGPDGIPVFVVRDCRRILAEPLRHIFNLCLEGSHFPERWRVTRVIPIPKGGGGSEIVIYDFIVDRGACAGLRHVIPPPGEKALGV
ncbi:Uncharacterized protein OBRU01_01369 [Operophtera brumata]|uniref:Uncharacterized protein n=1 Tax=Operophtera brumata TaxID=104452 RepID=A0A0L7LU44_OPEBR|nr:Uncharacterized protein OBRU01_01369 [Operophtera brumata]